MTAEVISLNALLIWLKMSSDSTRLFKREDMVVRTPFDLPADLCRVEKDCRARSPSFFNPEEIFPMRDCIPDSAPLAALPKRWKDLDAVFLTTFPSL